MKKDTMRRQDRLISELEARNILEKKNIGRIGMCTENQPYVIPVLYLYSSEDNSIYIHSATKGRKIETLRKNPNVCFEVDIERELIKGKAACDWGMKYKSVIGFGKAVFVEDAESKRKALDIIMQNYSEGAFEYSEEAVKKTVVIKVEIESMTGKKSGYQ